VLQVIIEIQPIAWYYQD